MELVAAHKRGPVHQLNPQRVVCLEALGRVRQPQQRLLLVPPPPKVLEPFNRALQKGGLALELLVLLPQQH